MSILRKCWFFIGKMCIRDILTTKILFVHWFSVYSVHSDVENVDFSLEKCVFVTFWQSKYVFIIGFLYIPCIPTRRLGQLAGPGWAAWAAWAGGAVREHPRSKKHWKTLQKWPGTFRHSLFSTTFWPHERQIHTFPKEMRPGLRAAASETTTNSSFSARTP